MNRSWTLSFDLTSVLVFVGFGRATHDTGTSLSNYLGIAAPFVIGLFVGWVATRAWRDPVAIRTGIGVMAATVTVGMLLRNLVWDDGTALVFVAVATAFLSLLMIGWRATASRLTPRSRPILDR